MGVAQTRDLSLSLIGSDGDVSSIYNISIPGMLERLGGIVNSECYFCPKLADFWITYLGLD